MGQGQRKTLLMTDINNNSDSMETRQRHGGIPVEKGCRVGHGLELERNA